MCFILVHLMRYGISWRDVLHHWRRCCNHCRSWCDVLRHWRWCRSPCRSSINVQAGVIDSTTDECIATTARVRCTSPLAPPCRSSIFLIPHRLLVLELSEQARRRQFVFVVKPQRLLQQDKMATGAISLNIILATQCESPRLPPERIFYLHVAQDNHAVIALELRDDMSRKLRKNARTIARSWRPLPPSLSFSALCARWHDVHGWGWCHVQALARCTQPLALARPRNGPPFAPLCGARGRCHGSLSRSC